MLKQSAGGPKELTNQIEEKKEGVKALDETEVKVPAPELKEVKVEKPKVARKAAKKAEKKIQKKEKKEHKRKSGVDRDQVKKYLKDHELDETAKHFGISYSLAWVIKTGYVHPKPENKKKNKK